MLVSLLLITAAILMLLVAGLPLTWFLLKIIRGNPDGESIWFISLFTGFSLIAIILKTLVAFNIPIKYTAWPLAAVIFLIFAVFILNKPNVILKPSKLFVIGFILVLAIQGAGYFAVGARDYMGYNWWDNIFYVTQAQFHIDYPIKTVFDSIPNQPWMAYAIGSSMHRISRSVLQGFIAVLCGVNADYTIGFISILSPVLTFCALNFAATRIKMNKYAKTAACFFAAMVPGLASLHLEGFLGAALIVPFLIFACVLFDLTIEKPSFGKCVLCAMVLATATTIYTEATLVFVLLALIVFIWSVISGKTGIRKVYIPFAVFAGALLINIQFFNSVYVNLFSASNTTHGLDSIYSFALSGKGFAYAYLGNEGIKFFGLLAILIALAGFLGIFIKFIENKSPTLLAFLALIISPIMFCYGDEVFLYNFFRMILIASPAVIFGLWLFFEKVYMLILESNLKAMVLKFPVKRTFLVLLSLCIASVSCISIWGTTDNIHHTIDQKSTRIDHTPSESTILLHRDLISLQGKNIFLFSQLNLESWWLMYYARNNNVWLCHESVDNYYVRNDRVDYSYLNLCNMPDPDNVIIVHDPTFYNAVYPESIRNRVDCYMISNTLCQVMSLSSVSDNSFELVVYSKDKMNGNFNFTVGMNDQVKNLSMDITVDNQPFNGVKNGDTLQIPLSIGRGFTKVEIRAVSSSDKAITPGFFFTGWSLDING